MSNLHHGVQGGCNTSIRNVKHFLYWSRIGHVTLTILRVQCQDSFNKSGAKSSRLISISFVEEQYNYLVSHAVPERVPERVGWRGVDDLLPGVVGVRRNERVTRVTPHAHRRATLPLPHGDGARHHWNTLS